MTDESLGAGESNSSVLSVLTGSQTKNYSQLVCLPSTFPFPPSSAELYKVEIFDFCLSAIFTLCHVFDITCHDVKL